MSPDSLDPRPDPDERAEDSAGSKPLLSPRTGEFIWLGIMFPACIFTGAFLGWLVDHYLGSRVGLWVGLGFGIAAAYYHLFQTLRGGRRGFLDGAPDDEGKGED